MLVQCLCNTVRGWSCACREVILTVIGVSVVRLSLHRSGLPSITIPLLPIRVAKRFLAEVDASVKRFEPVQVSGTTSKVKGNARFLFRIIVIALEGLQAWASFRWKSANSYVCLFKSSLNLRLRLKLIDSLTCTGDSVVSVHHFRSRVAD